MSPLTISVVVGAKNTPPSMVHCLSALERQAGNQGAEIILVDGSTAGAAEFLAGRFPQVRLLRGDPTHLVPQLWKQGYEGASGTIIAFTNANLVPAEDWLEQIAQSHTRRSDEEVAGVGGPVEGPVNGSWRDWTLYFARYSAYLPPGPAGPTHDLAGDNAAYKKSDLERCYLEMRAGFWESLVHARLIAGGKTLVKNPAMRVRLASAGSLGEMARMRFHHGRYFGSTRPGNAASIKRLFRILTAPLVPLVLFYRIARRVFTQRRDWFPHFLRAIPGLAVLLVAWSLGEALGYIFPEA
ncbi:MAG: glycosyltransferase [Anaerolineales bacterium]